MNRLTRCSLALGAIAFLAGAAPGSQAPKERASAVPDSFRLVVAGRSTSIGELRAARRARMKLVAAALAVPPAHPEYAKLSSSMHRPLTQRELRTAVQQYVTIPAGAFLTVPAGDGNVPTAEPSTPMKMHTPNPKYPTSQSGPVTPTPAKNPTLVLYSPTITGPAKQFCGVASICAVTWATAVGNPDREVTCFHSMDNNPNVTDKYAAYDACRVAWGGDCYEVALSSDADWKTLCKLNSIPDFRRFMWSKDYMLAGHSETGNGCGGGWPRFEVPHPSDGFRVYVLSGGYDEIQTSGSPKAPENALICTGLLFLTGPPGLPDPPLNVFPKN